MVESAFQPLVNVVVDSWELRSRLEFEYRNNDFLRLLVTEEPYRDPRVELYLLPVRLYLDLASGGRSPDLNQVPVICHGPAVLLEKAFMAGCSDYLKDPWALDEFGIRALHLVKARQLVFSWGIIRYDQFRIWNGERSQLLTKFEYRTLRTLLQYKGEMVTREYFYGLYDKSFRRRGHAVDLHVSGLRKKIDYCLPEEFKGSEVIMTIRRVGYLLR